MTPENPPGAVFLSYAREDSEAARRIADALRAFGVEVWFDQAELRGGDTWDQKIRKQIRDCSLFLPIISAATQGRGEGYFRREWKLGVERTHDMAAGLPFIMPVVVDATAEADAAVPEEFMRYQWTRLPHGVAEPRFVEQVKQLLAAPRRAAAPGRASVSAPAGAGSSVPARGRSTWILAALGAVAMAGAATMVLRPRPAPVPAAVPAPPPTAAAAGAGIPTMGGKSIAVLPFENMSEDKNDNAFFADGIHEDILTDLALLKNLRVVSRTSVMQYRSTTKPIRDIARELGVAYILEGSVQRAGNKVRVTGQLIRADSDEHVWAKAYDRDLTDIFAIQAELAQAIAGSMQAAISPAEQSLLDRRPTDNMAAYDHFLRSRRYMEGYAPSARVVDELQAAVAIDPKFAAAWAQLGAQVAFVYFSDEEHTAAKLERAKQAIETAHRLAPDDPAVIEATGDYYYYAFRDYDLAAQQYERLQQLRPNDPSLYSALALIARRRGRFGTCLADYRRMMELGDTDYTDLREYVITLLNLRRFDECEAVCRSAELRFPGRAGFPEMDAMSQFCRDGSTAGIKAYAEARMDPADIDEWRWWVKTNARITGDYAEAVRLDRAYPHLDIFVPHYLQDLMSACDLAGAGEPDAARALAATVLTPLEADWARQPDNADLAGSAAQAYALLGERAKARQAADRMVALLPEENDRLQGAMNAGLRAGVLAQIGDTDAAVAEMTRLLHTPFGGNVRVLRKGGCWFGGYFAALRGDPRIEALLRDPANNAPIPID